MATNKLGTLVYDLVADTKEFQQGLVKAGKPLTALKKLFIESRTPIEHFGIQLQGMQQMIRDGAGPLNMFSRSIADLAMQTKGGGRVARDFSQSLRDQASAIVNTTGQYHALSQADKDRVNRLRAAANAIEREVNIQRQSAAQTLKNQRATEQDADAAKEAQLQQRRLAEERERHSQAIARQIKQTELLAARQKAAASVIRDRQDPRRSLAREMTEIRALGAAGMLSASEVATEQKRILQSLKELNPEYQKNQQRLQDVQRGLQNLITPMQKNRKETRALIQEFKAGNVGSQQFDARLKQLRDEHKKLYEEQKKVTKEQNVFVKGMISQTTALLRQISAISALYTVIRQIRSGISDALEIGRSQRQFQTFTGSAEVAAGLMNDLRAFAAETPVTLQAGQQATRTLLQYGVEQSDVINVIRQLGDVSGGSTEALQRLSLAFGQITANTRLQGQELRQLIEAGFNPLAQISEKTGESMFDLRQRMADGALSAQEVAQAFDDATSGSGRFANALKNVATETDFGRIEKLRGELVRLRAEFGMAGAQIIGGFAEEVTDDIAELREEIRQELLLGREPTPEELRPIPLRGGATDLFGIRSMVERMVKHPSIQAMIDAQKEALELAQKQVAEEIPELLQQIYRPQDENKDRVEKVTDAIHERIAALRKERELLSLGANEAELQELRRQGASKSYIESLRAEMQALEDLKNQQKSREDAEKEAHDRRMKRLRERQQAEKKAIEERRSQIERDRQKAQALIDSVMTPLERLEKQMTEIQRVSEFLTPLQRTKLMAKALEAFNAEQAGDAAVQAAAVTRGSVEEFKLIAEINSTQVDQQQKHHNEAQDQRKQMNKKLDLQVKGIDMLPLKLGEELSELMPTAVGSSPASGGGFFGPRRGPEAYN